MSILVHVDRARKNVDDASETSGTSPTAAPFPLHAFDRFVAGDVNVRCMRIRLISSRDGQRVKPPSAIVARRYTPTFLRFL
jgi:hypothetical protein